MDEFENVLRRIVASPDRWRRTRGNNRQLNFHRFPYAIVYSVLSEVIYVKAVMHLPPSVLLAVPLVFPCCLQRQGGERSILVGLGEIVRRPFVLEKHDRVFADVVGNARASGQRQ